MKQRELDARFYGGMLDLLRRRVERLILEARGQGWRFRGQVFDPKERPAGPWRVVGNTGYRCPTCKVVTYGWARECAKCGAPRRHQGVMGRAMMQPETNFPKHPTCLGCGHSPHRDGECSAVRAFTGGGCMCTVEATYLAGVVPAARERAAMKGQVLFVIAYLWTSALLFIAFYLAFIR